MTEQELIKEEAATMRAYVLDLREPLTIKKLKPLIGREFAVKKMTRSWGKDVVDLDKLVITNIRVTADVATGKTTGLSAVHIYSDYWLEGRNKYNAWTGLKSFQKYLETISND